jgi:hypothetical protein
MLYGKGNEHAMMIILFFANDEFPIVLLEVFFVAYTQSSEGHSPQSCGIK